jgi:hypothetical protein
MASSSTLDPDNYPPKQSKQPKGHDTRALGPSDSSDSGSDMAGPGLLDDDMLDLDRGTNEDTEAGHNNIANTGASVGDLGMHDNSDRYGTGTRAAAGKESSIPIDGDHDVDRVVGEEEAGLGSGLDQAEEAQLGVTDEELARMSGASPRDEQERGLRGTRKKQTG